MGSRIHLHRGRIWKEAGKAGKDEGIEMDA
jgi:hypothetical protein